MITVMIRYEHYDIEIFSKQKIQSECLPSNWLPCDNAYSLEVAFLFRRNGSYNHLGTLYKAS